MAVPASVNEVAASQPGDLLLVDIRKKPDEAQIPGSVRYDGEAIERAEQPPFDRDKQVVLYCGSGNSCSRIAQTLQERGYTNVRALEGGYAAWKDAGLPTEPISQRQSLE
ncbi:MAG TPA: rhodanese-like domain-containing protein [Candidatus Baltobacteraceae bacterium]|nr:rhodanese-like domain-containing protein [Candidatus Baltobacteraceae bacterium]